MKENKDEKKTYGAKGEKYLEDIFKDAIGIGVNEAIRRMMDDVRNTKYGNIYDTHILVNNIQIKELTHELQKIQNRKKELNEELTLLDSSEKELEDAIERINIDNLEYQESKKKDRNTKLNDICNKVLIEYTQNRDSFDSMDIMRIVHDSEVEENMNIVVGYIQNTLKSLDIDDIVNLHENRFDEGYRIKLEKLDVDKLVDMLDDLKY